MNEWSRLAIGTRVRLNDLGKTKSPKLKAEGGIVTGYTRGRGYYVLLDGNKTTTILHQSLLEQDEAE